MKMIRMTQMSRMMAVDHFPLGRRNQRQSKRGMGRRLVAAGAIAVAAGGALVVAPQAVNGAALHLGSQPDVAPQPELIFRPPLPMAPRQTEVATMLGEVSEISIKTINTRLAEFGTRHTMSETESDVRGIGAARRWIKAQFEQYSRDSGRTGDEAMKVYFDSYQYESDGRRIGSAVELVNVVAEIPGSDPAARARRYYVIGHYDSRGSNGRDAQGDAPGANDDGSGTTLLMELARVMSKHRYDATIVFMATVAEEQGLIGARLHAEKAREADMDIRAVLSNDIVGDPTLPSGGVNRKQVRLFSEAFPRNATTQEIGRIRSMGADSDSPSRQLARFITETAFLYGIAPLQASSPATPVAQPLMIFRPDRFLRGGDHSAFNNSGYAAVRFCEIEENYNRQHQDPRSEDGVQYGDLPEYVDGDYLARVTRTNGAALAHLANAPSPPGNARIITARLTNDTTIRWDASPEADVAGYEVVWRQTLSPFWQSVRDVGNDTEATIPLSKDNYFFGVRAYDRDGYRSPVSYPRAARQ